MKKTLLATMAAAVLAITSLTLVVTILIRATFGNLTRLEEAIKERHRGRRRGFTALNQTVTPFLFNACIRSREPTLIEQFPACLTPLDNLGHLGDTRPLQAWRNMRPG